MTILDAEDIVNGSEGTVTAVIDGRVVELMEVKNINVNIALNKSDVKVLGSRGTKHKVTGWNGTGNMTVHYVSSRWNKIIIDYVKKGIVTVFDIIVKNEDPSSRTGKQSGKVSGVTIDGTDLLKLDTEADTLEQSIDFTFDDIDLLNEFDSLN